jgi:hypothetical protein
MPRSFEFRIIRYEPDARRGERVNIGLAVVAGKTVQVYLLKSMAKAQALAPQVRFHLSLQSELQDMLSEVHNTQGLDNVGTIGAFRLSEAGSMYCEANELPVRIEAAMKRLVNPARRPSAREGTTRLHTQIKRQFKSDGLLASDPSEITQHKVVAGFEFPGDEELGADFAFKNGAWLLTQVLDYRSVTVAAAAKKIKEVSLKAIALDQASKEPDRLLGDKLKVNTQAVVWVPEELTNVVGPQIDILEDYCGKIFRFQNDREQSQYWDLMKRLTKQYATAG